VTKDLEPSFRRVFNADLFRSVASRDLAASPLQAKRLLVVEEDADTRVALQIGLADVYEITAVADGTEALAMLDAQQFDLMLVDVKLPGAILREMRTGRLSIPAVFACETFAFIRIVKESGAAGLLKPLSLVAVEERLSFVSAEGFAREAPTEPSMER
jgi:CheY-like chemotaxis protein